MSIPILVEYLYGETASSGLSQKYTKWLYEWCLITLLLQRNNAKCIIKKNIDDRLIIVQRHLTK